MLYFANPCGDPAIESAMSAGQLGFIATPAQGNRRPHGAPWCADNGCYGKGYPGDSAWFSWLQKSERLAAVGSCAFATAPDVVGDYAATLGRALPWLPRLRGLGYPAALVAQDGMEASVFDPWDELDVLFIGGSTSWKLSAEARELVAVAKSLGKWVHMGRVNSERRFRFADAIGCDSCDGTFLKYAPRVNLPVVESWRRGLGQDALFAV